MSNFKKPAEFYWGGAIAVLALLAFLVLTYVVVGGGTEKTAPEVTYQEPIQQSTGKSPFNALEPIGPVEETPHLANAAPLPADMVGVAEIHAQVVQRLKTMDRNETINWDVLGAPVYTNQYGEDGYPAFALECDSNQATCYGPTGEALYVFTDLIKVLPAVLNSDAARPDWQCDWVCLDSQKHLVGAVQPEMRFWLSQHRK